MSRRWRVGVVGRHFGATVHAPAFRADRRCDVVAVAGQHDWRALLDADIDIVSVAVPPASQPAIVMAAAARGKHVFCEKPLGASVAAAQQALDAVTAARVTHGIDFLFPSLPSWQRVKTLLAEGACGPLRSFDYTWHIETYASRMNIESWKTRPEDGGGALGNFASHVFFNIESLLGPIRAIEGFALAPPPRSGRGVDGHVRLDDGVSGRISVRTDAPHGLGHVLELRCAAGTIRLANAGADYAQGFRVFVADRQEQTGSPETAAPGDGRIGAVARLASRLLDAVTGVRPMWPTLAHGQRVQDLLAAVESSGGAARAIAPPDGALCW